MLKKIIILIIISLGIIISIFLCKLEILYNKKNADLLVSTESCGGLAVFATCSKEYYIINSKDGRRKHISSKMLHSISFSSPKGEEKIKKI